MAEVIAEQNDLIEIAHHRHRHHHLNGHRHHHLNGHRHHHLNGHRHHHLTSHHHFTGNHQLLRTMEFRMSLH